MSKTGQFIIPALDEFFRWSFVVKQRNRKWIKKEKIIIIIRFYLFNCGFYGGVYTCHSINSMATSVTFSESFLLWFRGVFSFLGFLSFYSRGWLAAYFTWAEKAFFFSRTLLCGTCVTYFAVSCFQGWIPLLRLLFFFSWNTNCTLLSLSFLSYCNVYISNLLTVAHIFTLHS